MKKRVCHDYWQTQFQRKDAPLQTRLMYRESMRCSRHHNDAAESAEAMVLTASEIFSKVFSEALTIPFL